MVSVIIPTFNCEEFIKEAITSVLKQTYQEAEIVVIDDGSFDGTADQLKLFGKCIRYVRQENRGVSQARNTGIRVAKGEYIAFLDADDVWLREKLKVQIAFLEKFPQVAGVFSDFSEMDETGETLKYRSITKHYPVFKKYKVKIDAIFSRRDELEVDASSTGGGRLSVYAGNIFKTLFLGNLINTSSVLIRKEAIQKVGMFNPLLRTQEDYEYWLRLAKEFDLGYIDRALVKTRKHPGQLTRGDQKEAIARKSLEVLEEISKEAATFLERKIIATRLAEKYRTLGLVYLGIKRPQEARAALRKSYFYKPINFLTFFFYCWSFLPPRYEMPLRSGLRKVAKILNLR